MSENGSLTPQERSLYADGVEAAQRGKPFTANPHPQGTALHAAWMFGWVSWFDRHGSGATELGISGSLPCR